MLRMISLYSRFWRSETKGFTRNLRFAHAWKIDIETPAAASYLANNSFMFRCIRVSSDKKFVLNHLRQNRREVSPRLSDALTTIKVSWCTCYTCFEATRKNIPVYMYLWRERGTARPYPHKFGELDLTPDCSMQNLQSSFLSLGSVD